MGRDGGGKNESGGPLNILSALTPMPMHDNLTSNDTFEFLAKIVRKYKPRTLIKHIVCLY